MAGTTHPRFHELLPVALVATAVAAALSLGLSSVLADAGLSQDVVRIALAVILIDLAVATLLVRRRERRARR